MGSSISRIYDEHETYIWYCNQLGLPDTFKVGEIGLDKEIDRLKELHILNGGKLKSCLNNMTNQDIKNECERYYEVIKNAKEKLAEIRKECKHTETFQGNYSWRVGATYPALICSSCGEVVKNLLLEKFKND